MDNEKLIHAIERYERSWLLFALVMIVVFLIFIGYTLTGFAFYVPSAAERIDPTTVRNEGSLFANPRVEKTGDNVYTAYVLAQAFTFLPGEIRVPKGAKVVFYVTSPDVQHGFHIRGTNVNVQVIPGEVGKVEHTFDEPGEYLVICNEYCGLGHQDMIGKIIVEDK
ncbi:cytochrome c oxidase subunit II [Oceanithermus profundus]